MTIRIHDIGNYALRNYLLETPLGWIAIDTGYTGRLGNYLARFSKLAPPHTIQYVFLTHAHNDHAGFLGELLEKTGARLIASAQSLPRLATGKNAMPEGAGFLSPGIRLLSGMMRKISFPPVAANSSALVVSDESDQPLLAAGLPIRILHLPGHTADSIALILEETGDLFCGDAAANFPLAPARQSILIENLPEFGRSWDRMLAAKPSRIYPSHGNPFPPEDLVKYRHFMDGKQLCPPK
ncbi:MAG: MBL fold metallo-hydrolase [Christensenella sp.]|nr:MBL fold metallo-hydrolase [Christensenella sp.]